MEKLTDVNLEREVLKIWGNSVSSKNSTDVKVGLGTLADYAYDNKKLKSNETDLMEILTNINTDKEDLRFRDLADTNNGKWTQLRQRIDLFSSMLNALEIIEYEEYPLTYDLEKNNPKIKVLKK